MALRDFWRRRDEPERPRFPLDPLSRDSWHEEADARYGAQRYRNHPSFDAEQRRFNDRWQSSYSGPGYQRFDDSRTEYGGSSNSGDPTETEPGRWEQRQLGEHRGRGPRGYRRSDERIKEDVCQCLTDDSHIDASNIDVSVNDREVVLAGSVQTRYEKRHAEDLIERIAGVRDVINSLRVTNT